MRPACRRTVSVLSAGCAALAVAALPALTASAAAGAAPRVEVRDTHPSWAVRSAEVAQAPSGKSIKARVYLSPRDESALDRAVAAVSTPASPGYGHYITPAQFRAQYGPAPDAAAKVSSWLRGTGLKVSALQENGRYFTVTGSVSSAQKAFGTNLSIYRRAGGSYQAPTGTVTVPTTVSPYVLSVTGLDESPATVSPKAAVDLLPSQYNAIRKQPKSAFPIGFRNARPCGAYYGQLTANVEGDYTTKLPIFQGRSLFYTVCGYTPQQLRSAYGVPAALTGKGVTVAVIDAYQSPTLLKDANRYSTDTGGKPFAAGQFTTIGPPVHFYDQEACGASGWSSEQSLDVEAVHGFAPDAKVLYASGASCNGIDLLESEVQVVDDNRASIVSLSYGDIESNETTGQATFDTYLFKQAALQGIGFYIATGDNGDEVLNTGVKQVDSSASNPYATAVGGTSIAIGAQGQYKFETGWGTNLWSLAPDGKSWIDPQFHGGGGGGFSALFNAPAYQKGVVPAGSPAGRALPDVGMDADPTTGMLLGLTQQFPHGVFYDVSRAGGTSLAAPLFAGVQALTSQAQHARLGFANPRIYALAGRQYSGKQPVGSSQAAFRDVTGAHDGAANVRADFVNGANAADGVIYTVRSFDDDSSLATATGWDDVTGVGSPAPGYYTATGR
jgi:subtilase family serine protease